MDAVDLEARIDALAGDPDAVRGKKGRAIDEVIEALDEGRLRVAEPSDDGWVTHAWIKRAILLYFARMDNVAIAVDGASHNDATGTRELPPSYFDKLPVKRNYKKLGAFAAFRRAWPGTAVSSGAGRS